MNYFLPEKQLAKFAFIYIYKDKRCNTSQIDIYLLIVENIYIYTQSTWKSTLFELHLRPGRSDPLRW